MKIITTKHIKKGQILSESHLFSVKNNEIDSDGKLYTSSGSGMFANIHRQPTKKKGIEPFIGKRARIDIPENYIVKLKFLEDANIQIRKEKKIKNYKEIVVPQIKNNLWL
jgi:flagellar basal body rod protein FlgF